MVAINPHPTFSIGQPVDPVSNSLEDDWIEVPVGEDLTEDFFVRGGPYYGWHWWLEGLAPGAATLTLTYNGHGLTIEDEARVAVGFGNTKWLVVHDPDFEAEHCQPSSIPRCKQAELMSNVAQFWTCGVDEGAGPPEARLVQVDAVSGDDLIVTVGGERFGDCWRFLFDTTVGSTTDGAKTDADGGIYVEGIPIPGPSNPVRMYEVEVYVDSTRVAAHLLRISPLLAEPLYQPNIVDSPPWSLDPYSHQFDVDDVDSGKKPGYDSGEGFGLLLSYRLLDYVTAFSFNIENDPSSAIMGDIAGACYEVRVTDQFDEEARYKSIKWEGYSDNSWVIDEGGFTERSSMVFLGGQESERPVSWTMGVGGPTQTHRGVAPSYVVREGSYINRVRLCRALDGTQWQEIEVPFEVKYEID